MTENIVSIEIAKQLKDIGFNYPCTYAYCQVGGYNKYTGKNEPIDYVLRTDGNNSGEYYIGKDWNKSIEYNKNKIVCSAPTQSLAQKWLREKKQLHIVIQDSLEIETHEIRYYPVLYPFGEQYDNLPQELRYERGLYVYLGKVWKSSYEEALEVGIEEAIKLLT